MHCGLSSILQLLDVQEAGEDLVTEVMAGLRQRMMEMDWLDSITRERAIEKVDTIYNS